MTNIKNTKKCIVALILTLVLVNVTSAEEFAEIITSSLTYAYGDNVVLLSNLTRKVSGNDINDLSINVDRESFAKNVNYLYSELVTTNIIYEDGVVKKKTAKIATSTYSENPFSGMHILNSTINKNSTDIKIENVMEKSDQKYVYDFANTFAKDNVSLAPIFAPKYAYYNGFVTFATGTSNSIETAGARYNGGITLETVIR